jgi:hypothetical protein
LAEKSKSGALKISSREELRKWLESLPPERGRWVAVAIAARAALRVAPTAVVYAPVGDHLGRKRRFLDLVFGLFLSSASARVAAIFQTRPNESRALAASKVVARANEHAATARCVAARAARDAARAAASAFTSHAVSKAADAVHWAADTDTFAADVWKTVSHDANFIGSGGTVQMLAEAPLWPKDAPD